MDRLMGGIILAAGILIATLSGLCSLAFFVMMINPNGTGYGARDAQGFFSTLMLIAMFGGPPFGIGAFLIFYGRRVLRRNRPVDPSDVF